MRIIRKILRVIDSTSEQTGKVARWCCLAMMLFLVFESTMRYAFNMPTVWVYETTMMLFGAIALLGFAYVSRKQRHIRIDVFYSRFSPRTKAIIDAFFGSIFLFPFLALLIYISAKFAWESYVTQEVSIKGIWFPPLLPSRIVFLLGVSLLLFQSIAEFSRNLYFLIRRKPLD